MGNTSEPLDLTEELRLRRWARENYVPAGERDASWHPVVLDEMQRRDQEGAATAPAVRAVHVGTAPEVHRAGPSDDVPCAMCETADQDVTAQTEETELDTIAEQDWDVTADMNVDVTAEAELDVVDEVGWGKLFAPIAELHCLHGPHELSPPHTCGSTDNREVAQVEHASDSSRYLG